MTDWKRIREDFPVLKRVINGRRLVYLDSACMSLKPRQVINAMNEYYEQYPACAGRSIHKLGEEASNAYSASRGKYRRDYNFRNGGLRNGWMGPGVAFSSFNRRSWKFGKCRFIPDRSCFHRCINRRFRRHWNFIGRTVYNKMDAVRTAHPSLAPIGGRSGPSGDTRFRTIFGYNGPPVRVFGGHFFRGVLPFADEPVLLGWIPGRVSVYYDGDNSYFLASGNRAVVIFILKRRIHQSALTDFFFCRFAPFP